MKILNATAGAICSVWLAAGFAYEVNAAGYTNAHSISITPRSITDMYRRKNTQTPADGIPMMPTSFLSGPQFGGTKCCARTV
jgi:hypothetical protein